MEFFSNLTEYYDELFPVTDSLKSFFSNLSKNCCKPINFLDIGCGTGTLDFDLAKKGYNVTGIDANRALINSASLKHRTQLLSIRFFYLSTKEMTSFLGRKFYNIIFCGNSRLTFLKTEQALFSFLKACTQLLAENGFLVLHLQNFEPLKSKKRMELPKRTSLRAQLSSVINRTEIKTVLTQKIEISKEKTIPILEKEPILPITQKHILNYGKKAGFSKIQFYSDFNRSPFAKDSIELVCILKL